MRRWFPKKAHLNQDGYITLKTIDWYSDEKYKMK